MSGILDLDKRDAEFEKIRTSLLGVTALLNETAAVEENQQKTVTGVLDMI